MNIYATRTPDGIPICFIWRGVGHVQHTCHFQNTGNRGRRRGRFKGILGSNHETREIKINGTSQPRIFLRHKHPYNLFVFLSFYPHPKVITFQRQP